MIPKKIHYCWFGDNPMPKLAKACIKSWKKFCPDYEIKEWNESNFDLDLFPYAREAYDAKKYAFVTDVVRLYALYHEGGIYMDTDVELLQSIDKFLHHLVFSGFESEDSVTTGIMASVQGSRWAKENLEHYIGKHFLKEDGSLDLTTNVSIITEYMINHGLLLNNTYQEIEGAIAMYPKDYFCPKDFLTQEMEITANTACIHHFNMSWHSAASRRQWRMRWFFSKFMKEKLAFYLADKLSSVICKIERFFNK